VPELRALVTWIGNTDIAASESDSRAGVGPIAQGVTAYPITASSCCQITAQERRRVCEVAQEGHWCGC